MNHFDEIESFESLAPSVRQLIDEAVRARDYAYTPYSRFNVGAALRTLASDRVFAGCNVENASFGVAICAERVACVKAVSVGRLELKEMAVVAEASDESFVTPCGACRQFVAEFSKKSDVRIYLTGPTKGSVAVTSIRQLLPFTFQL